METLEETLQTLKQTEVNGQFDANILKQIKNDFFDHIRTIAQQTFDNLEGDKPEDDGQILEHLLLGDKEGYKEIGDNFKQELEKQHHISYNNDNGKINFNITGINDIKLYAQINDNEMTTGIDFSKLDQEKKRKEKIRKIILIVMVMVILTLIAIATALLVKHFKNKNDNISQTEEEKKEEEKKEEEKKEEEKKEEEKKEEEKLKNEGEESEQPDKPTFEEVIPDPNNKILNPNEKGDAEQITLSNKVIGETDFVRNKDCEIAKYIETHPNANIDIVLNGKQYKMPLNVKIDTNGNCNFIDCKTGQQISSKAENCQIYCHDCNYGIISNNVKNIMKSQEIIGNSITYTNTSTNVKVNGHTLNIDYQTGDGTVYGNAKIENVYYNDGRYLQKQNDGSYAPLSNNLQEILSNTNNKINQNSNISLESLLRVGQQV